MKIDRNSTKYNAGIKILYLCEYGSIGVFLICAIRALWLNYS